MEFKEFSCNDVLCYPYGVAYQSLLFEFVISILFFRVFLDDLPCQHSLSQSSFPTTAYHGHLYLHLQRQLSLKLSVSQEV
jgi:hypothetical protein